MVHKAEQLKSADEYQKIFQWVVCDNLNNKTSLSIAVVGQRHNKMVQFHHLLPERMIHTRCVFLAGMSQALLPNVSRWRGGQLSLPP